ncbi:signaling lymphocytic activation molecule [Rhea pennata]|uniref:signaling lymphocytic activation molecule n=1 Tax=Rhea pennata TaxID=8795 RepID=UPI002E26236F
MGCGACLWLLSSFCCAWGASRGTRETVLGTLGKATFLRIPLELQELTVRSGTAVWKRDTEDPQSKLVLLKYSGGNYTNYMQEQTRFHQANFSLEILNTSRQDRQLYEYIITEGAMERVWQIELEVYEPVSEPRIQVLNRTLANDSCTVILNCTAERGDQVSYSWAGASHLCARNGSLLHLSYSLRNGSLACACAAANPVSRRAAAFNTSECGPEQQVPGRPGSRCPRPPAASPSLPAGLSCEAAGLWVPPPAVLSPHAPAQTAPPCPAALGKGSAADPVASSVPAAGAKQERAALAEDGAVHTIYSQVQRAEKPRGPRGPPAAAEHPACTTIYAAATGLPPDTAPAPAPARQQCPARGPHTEPPARPGPPLRSQVRAAAGPVPTACFSPLQNPSRRKWLLQETCRFPERLPRRVRSPGGRSPRGSPHGRRLLPPQSPDQGPTTVYASVTLPKI